MSWALAGLILTVSAIAVPVTLAPSAVAGTVSARRVGSLMPVAIAPTADGRGFWVASENGVVTPEGDAVSYGDASSLVLNAPIVDIATTASGHGYWLVAADGGIFTFGDAGFYGSTGHVQLNQAIVGMAPTPTGHGYWMVAADGGIFAAFGQAAAIVTTPVLSNAPCIGNPAGRKLLIISISEQQLWACQGGQILTTSAVTTGKYITPHNVNHSTPTGIFHVYSKQTTRFLNGCDINGCRHDFVNFWMPFDGEVGLHDAPWQTFPFGSPQYATSGSEGCVHLPEREMSWVFTWAPLGTTVTVHS